MNLKNIFHYMEGRLLRKSMLFMLGMILLASCRDDTKPDYSLFVSSELKTTFTESGINILFDFAGQTYPDINRLKPYISDGVNVYRMVFRTTVNNEMINASGLVCVPSTRGKYPVLCFQNGTNTLKSDAPSENVSSPSYELIEFIASLGFVVVIPDYPGFGESDQIPHPYLVKEPTVRSSLDMIDAVMEGMDLNFNRSSIIPDYYLLGYSQGGWATLALHKEMDISGGRYHLMGSVCGAGPYDIYSMFTSMVGMTTYPMPSYLGYIGNSYSIYGQFTNPLSDLFNEPYATRIGSLYNGDLSLDQINQQLTSSIPELLTPGLISGLATSDDYTSVRAALVNNSIAPWKSEAPLLFIHGQADSDVNVSSTESYYDKMIAAGTPTDICKKIILPGLDHSGAVVPSMVEGLLFLLEIRDNQ
jgi:pimeloyl-ACP methyl ester carboxylesterase